MKRLLILSLIALYSSVSFCKLGHPFQTNPHDFNNNGVGWISNVFPEIGDLAHNDNDNLIAGSSAGSILTFIFDQPFKDGPGKDFAIETVPANITWGNLADQAEFSLYLDDTFVASFTAKLNKPGTIFEFELPGKNIVANRISIKNLATYRGNWDETSIVYADAGIAYCVPEPCTILLLALGGLVLRKK